MRWTLLTALLLLAPTTVLTVDAADAAEPDCAGTPCDAVNRVCQRVGGQDCLGAAVEVDADASLVDCMGCDDVNKYVCKPVFGSNCVAAGADDDEAADSDCTGTPCDEINLVCRALTKGDCLGVAVGTGTATASAPQPDSGIIACMGLPCDVVNDVCCALHKYFACPCVL